MKNLKKLVVVSAAALALAGAVVPTAEAYYNSPGTGKEYSTLTRVPESEYGIILQELTTAIAAVRAEIGVEGPAGSATGSTGLILAVKNAEAALSEAQGNQADAQAAYDDAKAAHEAAVAELEEAKLAEADAKAAHEALAASYGEYQTKKTELVNTRDAAIDAADTLYIREEAVALPKYEAVKAVYDAALIARDDLYETVNGADFDALPADTQQQKRDDLAAAESALTEAENNLNKAKVVYNNEVAAADSKRNATQRDARATYTVAKDVLDQEYINSDIYGEYASVEEALAAYQAAQARTAAAIDDKAAKETALADALSELQAANTALRNEQLALAAAQANLSAAYAKKADLELNLNQLVAGQTYLGENSDLNLTEEQIELIEEIAGQSSADLQAKLEQAQADAAAAEERRNELEGEESAEETEEAAEGEETEETTTATDGTTPGGNNGGTPAPNTPGKTLPATGESTTTAVLGAAVLSILAGFGLVAPKFKKED